MTNPYLDTMQAAQATNGTDPAAANPYLDAMQREQEEKQRMLRGSLAQSVTTAPAAYGAQRQAAQSLGYPPAVGAAVPAVIDQAKVRKVEQDIAQSPVLQKRYRTDADFARLAHEDSGVLAAIEQNIGALAKWTLGGGFIDTARAFPATFEGSSAGAKKAVVDVIQPWARLITGNKDNWFQGMSDYYGRVAASAEDQVKNLRRGDGTLVSGGVDSGGQSLLQSAKYLPLAVSGPPGAAAALFGTALETFGQSYNKVSVKGLGLNQSLLYAASDAVIEYGTERNPWTKLIGDIKVGTPLMTTILRNAWHENKGEQVATLLQDANEWATINPEKSLADFLKERPAAAAQTFIATLVGAGGNSSIAVGLQKAADMMQPVQAAERQAELLKQAFTLASTSQLRELAPDQFRSVLGEMAGDAEVRFDARTLNDALMQSGLTLKQVQTALPSVLPQMEAAIATGGEVAVPVGEFIAGVSGTPLEETLQQHARLGDNELSQAEAKAAGEKAGEFLQSSAESVIQGAADQTAAQQNHDNVKLIVLDQLAATKRFRPPVNEAYATFTAAFYATMAARKGVTPEQLYAQYPLRIGATQLGGENLDQPAPASQVDFTREALPALLSRSNWAVLTAENPNAQKATPRGKFSPSALQITLLENADLSTFLHESAHFFLEVLADIATQPGADPGVVKDMESVLAWFGVTDIYEWNTLPLKGPNGKEPHHERFAVAFEQYLFGGKAPSLALRSVFSRFAGFLKEAYKMTMQAFSRKAKVGLSNEVRGVFDRLLATEADIEQAERQAGFEAIYSTAAEAGMTPEEWDTYQEARRAGTDEAVARLQARSLADLKWGQRAFGRELRRLQSEVAGIRDRMRDDVEREVRASPVEQARAFIANLRTSTPEQKAALKAWRDQRAAQSAKNLDAVKAEWLARPENADFKGIKKGQWLAKNKRLMANEAERRTLEWEQQNPRPVPELPDADMDVLAERFGYTSGDALRQDLLEAPKANDLIEATTDQRMIEDYSELVQPGALEAAAQEAVHNEARGRAVATEMAMLEAANSQTEEAGATRAGKPIRVNAIVKAAKLFAEAIINRRKIKDLKPNTYLKAEGRAGKVVAESMKAADTAAAAAKRDQLLNGFAFTEATHALSEVERAVAYLRKFNKEGTRKNLDADYLDQIDKLLERFDLRASVSDTDLDRRATLRDWLEDQRDLGVEPNIPPALLAETNRVSYKELSVEDFRGVVDTVRQVEHLARLKNRLLNARDKREFEAIRDEIAAGIAQHAGGRSEDTRTSNTLTGQALQSVKGFWASHIKAATWARVMDGGKDGGPVWEHFVRTANDAGNMEVVMRERAGKALHAIVAPVLKQGRMHGKGKLIPEIGRSMNHEAVLAVALNTGNASNMQRLMGGEGWTQAQVDAILSRMTRTDWQFVQQVWDYFETYRPLIAAKERRVNGVEPTWIEAVPREVTLADGTTMQLRGGYYPVKFDPRASEKAESHEDAEGARAKLKAAYTSATTRRSFTKERVEEVNDRPLLYSLDGVFNGVQEVIHDLAWHEWLIDTNKLLRDKKIAAAMRTKYGPDAHQQFKRWAEDVAVGDRGAQHAGEAALGWVRHSVSMTGLGFNVMSALVQPLGLTQSIVRVGAKHIGHGLVKFVGAPLATADEINSKSEFMRTRPMTRLRELAEVRAQVKGQSATRRAIDGGAYYLMLRMQQTVDIPTWWGAYEKALSEGSDEARSVALADQAVIDAQSSGTEKDQSAIERGSAALKLFTTFYSFFNTALNVGVQKTMNANTPAKKAKLAADYLLLYTVPVVLGVAMKDALTPGDSGDDDSWQKLLRKLLGEQMSYLFGLMFLVREVGTPLANQVKGESFGTDYQGPAGLRMLGDITKLAKQGAQGEADDGLRKAIVNMAGDLLRLPSAQINRSWNGIQALRDGKTQKPAAVVFGYQEPK
jgi:hypothetical protein